MARPAGARGVAHTVSLRLAQARHDSLFAVDKLEHPLSNLQGHASMRHNSSIAAYRAARIGQQSCYNTVQESRFGALAQQPARVEALSAMTDAAFTLILIGMYVLLGRLQLGTAAMILAEAILLYCMLNLLLFPNALIRLISQPMLAVILALAYINSHQLRALSIAAWLTIVVIFWRSNHPLISNEPIVDFVALCAASAIILVVL